MLPSAGQFQKQQMLAHAGQYSNIYKILHYKSALDGSNIPLFLHIIKLPYCKGHYINFVFIKENEVHLPHTMDCPTWIFTYCFLSLGLYQMINKRQMLHTMNEIQGGHKKIGQYHISFQPAVYFNNYFFFHNIQLVYQQTTSEDMIYSMWVLLDQ